MAGAPLKPGAEPPPARGRQGGGTGRGGPSASSAHLLHVFSNFVATGPEVRTVQLIGALGGEFRHSIVSMDGRAGAAERLPPGAAARLLEAPPRAGTLRTVPRLLALLRRERPDLVLTYGWGAFDMVLAALITFRGPRALRVVHHEEGFSGPESQFNRRRVLARRLILPGIFRLVVPSRGLMEFAVRAWKVPPEKLCLIPNGVDADHFRLAADRSVTRRELGLPDDALVVGTVSRLRPVKNLPRLLAAMAELAARLPEAHLLIVGDGPEREALEARAAALPELAGRVCFAGEQSDLPRFYRAMDVFALPSDSEQMPVSLLEAMACGVPAVATDVGDVREVLPAEQRAFVVAIDGAGQEQATVGHLAQRLETLLRDRGLRQRLGLANRQRVERRYTFEAMRRTYRDLYWQGIGGRHGGGAEQSA
ncbi:MAG TPA: glycosyltransferase [Thermoanaerobaculia bacterium]|nr:glycosyltransferase [Thermoanaerobaculia bacterium]